MLCLKEWISASTYPGNAKQAVPAASSAGLGQSAKAREKDLMPHGLEMVSFLISRAPGLNTTNQTSCFWSPHQLLSTRTSWCSPETFTNFHGSHLKILVPLASVLVGVGCQSSAVVQTPLWTSNISPMIAALEAIRATKKRIYSKESPQKGRNICKMHMPAVTTRLLHSCPSSMWWEVNYENSF